MCPVVYAGTLRFGYIDVTEAQFGVMAIHMVSVILGPEFWAMKVRVTVLTLAGCDMLDILNNVQNDFSCHVYEILYLLFIGILLVRVL